MEFENRMAIRTNSQTTLCTPSRGCTYSTGTQCFCENGVRDPTFLASTPPPPAGVVNGPLHKHRGSMPRSDANRKSSLKSERLVHRPFDHPRGEGGVSEKL